jgi:flagellum-specific peptidoglycan hydrolase FlgJ
MNYVGEKGKSILQSYNTAIEGLMDQYAANPSDELEKKISELVVQAKDFSNKAVAERQTGIEQLNAIIANPEAYDTTVEEARRAFTERYDTPVNAMFDFESNEVLLDSEAGKVRLGAYGQYNGEDPFYIPKRSEMTVIKPVGEWASTNKDLFDMNSDTYEQDVIGSFVKTARYDDELANTAIYNYLNDVEKMPITTMSETGVAKAVQDVVRDPDRFSAALEHQGRLEAGKLTGYATSEAGKKFKTSWDNTFTGGVNSLEETRTEYLSAPQFGEVSEAVAPNAGVIKTFDLKSPIDNSVMTVLPDNKRIVSFNVGADGRFYVQEEVIDIDEDSGEEIARIVETSYTTGSDEYESLKRIIPADVRMRLFDESTANANAISERRNRERFDNARRNADRLREEAASIDRKPLTKSMTEEQKAAEVANVVADVGLNSPVSAKQTQGAFDVTTYGGQPVLREIAEKLADKGYDASQIKSALQSKRFGEILEREELSPESSALRRTASVAADAVFGWMGYESKMTKDTNRMAEIAEQQIIQQQSDESFAKEADAREQERQAREADENLTLFDSNTKEGRAQNYDLIRDVAREEGLKFPEAVAAQFAKESSYGRQVAGKNNFFGIKYTDRMQRIFEERGISTSEGSSVTTPEYYDGQRTEIQDTFFNFESIRDAIKAYKVFIEENPRYSEALKADSTAGYLDGLQKAGYATDPNYASSLMNDYVSLEEGR